MSPVDVSGVTKRFGRFTAVDRVDLGVERGEVVAVVGANGAGKTTLIKMLLGLLLPTEGSVRVFGEPPSVELRRRIGYVPQNLGLYGDLTVDENLRFRNDVFGGRRSVATVGNATTGDVADRLVVDLPHGMQRQVAFAAALRHRPDVLVLDEPTSGVSPLARSDLWGLIRSEAERGVAVLVSTHYMDEALQADRLVVMTRGRVVADGSADDVVGGRHTFVVEAAQWADAFDVIDGEGRRPLLAGRTIRVPVGDGVDRNTLERLLARAGVLAEIRTEPATLEEAMVELSR